jgi:hypothetical protein
MRDESARIFGGLVAFDVDVVRFEIFETLQTPKVLQELLLERSTYTVFNILSSLHNVYKLIKWMTSTVRCGSNLSESAEPCHIKKINEIRNV